MWRNITVVVVYVSNHLKLLDLIWGIYILLNTLLSSWYISIPMKINWEENIPRDTTEWEWQVAVCKLFEERPIWPRRSLHEHLLDDAMQVSENQLKRFPIHSFNFHRCHGLSLNEFHVLWFCCYWLYVLVLPFLNEQNWGQSCESGLITSRIGHHILLYSYFKLYWIFSNFIKHALNNSRHTLTLRVN